MAPRLASLGLALHELNFICLYGEVTVSIVMRSISAEEFLLFGLKRSSLYSMFALTTLTE